LLPHPTLRLFPYTTLFRSEPHAQSGIVAPRLVERILDLCRQLGHTRDDQGEFVLLFAKGLGAHRSSPSSSSPRPSRCGQLSTALDRKSTRLNSSHVKISYA